MTKVSNGLWTNLCRKKEEPNKSFSSEYALDEEDKQQKTITDLHRRLCHRQDPENFITLNT